MIDFDDPMFNTSIPDRPQTAVARDQQHEIQENTKQVVVQDEQPPPVKEVIQPIRPVVERPGTAVPKKKKAAAIKKQSGWSSSSEEEGLTEEEKKQRKIEQIKAMLEVDKKRLREQFKDWFKPDAGKIKKKNYIGDQIVVEKFDQENEEDT